ncbi:MAG: hypothetical protein AAF636_27915 [Pseudomonadota bacterium]
MKNWSLKDAEREFERVISMSDDEFRAEIISAGEDPDRVIAQFEGVVLAAIARARTNDDTSLRNDIE